MSRRVVLEASPSGSKESCDDFPGYGYRHNPEERRTSKIKSLKKTNYRCEKTPEQRAIRYIKRKSRYHFPLVGNFCECRDLASVRHHTTNPIEFDKFIFMCTLCHNRIHKKNSYKEVKK